MGAAFPLDPLKQNYMSQENWLTTEAQHLWETEVNSFVAGLRYQQGKIEAQNEFTQLPARIAPFDAHVEPMAERIQGYVYDTVRPWQTLTLTLGLSYDTLKYPVNFRASPLSAATDRSSQASPKAGVVWTPLTNLWLRGAYTRSLGGVSFEQSIRLEPTQVGGFNHAYRSLISESLAGSLTTVKNEAWPTAAECRWALRRTMSASNVPLTNRI
ncbi:MAG: TonB-dependent receptor [Pedosphaera sp.]|nr:TonB-dependent receptor [Pedosphaera sp.]